MEENDGGFGLVSVLAAGAGSPRAGFIAEFQKVAGRNRRRMHAMRVVIHRIFSRIPGFSVVPDQCDESLESGLRKRR
jgi:hypothetical protein